MRLNGNPPNAEIGQLAALVLGGNERLVWLPQLTAALATSLAVFGHRPPHELDGSRVALRRARFRDVASDRPATVHGAQRSRRRGILHRGRVFRPRRRSSHGCCCGTRAGARIRDEDLGAALARDPSCLVVVAARRRPLLENAAIIASVSQEAASGTSSTSSIPARSTAISHRRRTRYPDGALSTSRGGPSGRRSTASSSQAPRGQTSISTPPARRYSSLPLASPHTAAA